jgi:hypothetical protein
MRLTSSISILLLASAAFTGCKKSDKDKPAEATKTAPAPAAAPAAPSGVTVKSPGNGQDEGLFDGTKAIAVTSAQSAEVVIPRGCGPDFNCNISANWASAIDDEKLNAACPTGAVLTVTLHDIKAAGEPKPGKHSVGLSVHVLPGSYSGFAGGDVLEVTERTDDVIAGKVAFTEGQNSVTGAFKATVCKPPK